MKEVNETHQMIATQKRSYSEDGIAAIKVLADAIAARVVELLDIPEVLLDTHGMAQHLGVSTSTVERLAKKGDIPKVKIGDLTRYSPSKVIKALTVNEKGKP